jgi:hypothetical protein
MSNIAYRTPRFRVSFPVVFEPKAMEGGKPKYSVMMIFDKKAQASDAFKAIKKSVVEELKAAWPKAPEKVIKERFAKVFKRAEDCESKEDGSRYEGCEDGFIVLRGQSTFKPEIINQRKEAIEDQNDFYAGCYAIAKITPASFDMDTNKGVTLYLGNIMKVAEGDRLGSVRSASNDFEDVEAEVEDISLAADDDIPF